MVEQEATESEGAMVRKSLNQTWDTVGTTQVFNMLLCISQK